MNNNEKEIIIGKEKETEKENKNRSYTKVVVLIVLFILFGAVCAGLAYYFSNKDITYKKDEQMQIFLKDNEKLTTLNKSLEEKLSKLSADYDKIYKDRENVIEQSKRIIQERNELLTAKERIFKK